MTVDEAIAQPGQMVIFDLPMPYDPVLVNVDRPLSEQLPAGPCLEAAKKMLADYRKATACR